MGLKTAALLATPTAEPGPSLDHRPELDGLRGVAVLAVLAFHSGWGEPFDGGYLGVSIFFTLSGFLVVQVLLAHERTTGKLGVGRFARRRVWRLLPASAITLSAVLVLARLGSFDAGTVRDSVPWAALHVANWAELASGDSYTDLFRQPSPVAHFWSLSIEEQFYLALPVSIALLIRRRASSGSRARPDELWRSVATLCAVAFVASALVVAWAVWRDQPDTVYFSTLSRTAEIAAGGVVGALVFGGRWRRAPTWLLPVLLLALISAFVVADPVDSSWPYRGGLPVFAVVGAVALADLARPSRARRWLSSRWLIQLGIISYGLYLVHWPTFLLVRSQGWSDTPWLRDLASWSISIALAAGLFVLVERPLRRSAHPSGRTLAVAIVVPIGLIAGSLTLSSDDGATAVTSIEQLDPAVRDQVISVAPAGASSTELPSSSEIAPDRAVILVGDSTAVAAGAGLLAWADDPQNMIDLTMAASGACGLVRGGNYADETLDAALQMECPPLLDQALPEQLETRDIDTLVLMISLADTWERSWDDEEGFLTPTDPAYAEAIRRDYRSFVEQAVDNGVEQIVWIRPPVALVDGEPEPAFLDGGQEVVEQTVRDLAAEYPITVIDLREAVETGPAGDVFERPDGIHMSQDASTRLAQEYLGDALLDAIGEF